jgi:hypothetical protein
VKLATSVNLSKTRLVVLVTGSVPQIAGSTYPEWTRVVKGTCRYILYNVYVNVIYMLYNVPSPVLPPSCFCSRFTAPFCRQVVFVAASQSQSTLSGIRSLVASQEIRHVTWRDTPPAPFCRQVVFVAASQSQSTLSGISSFYQQNDNDSL